MIEDIGNERDGAQITFLRWCKIRMMSLITHRIHKIYVYAYIDIYPRLQMNYVPAKICATKRDAEMGFIVQLHTLPILRITVHIQRGTFHHFPKISRQTHYFFREIVVDQNVNVYVDLHICLFIFMYMYINHTQKLSTK